MYVYLFLNVQLSGLAHTHTVVPPSPPLSTFRTFSPFQTEALYPINTNLSTPPPLQPLGITVLLSVPTNNIYLSVADLFHLV